MQLPDRIRVHALAKLLGTTSKRILAHLTELGAEARSPQSSLDRTVAESVREALTPAESAEAAAEPGAAVAEAETTAVVASEAGTDAEAGAAEKTAAAEAAIVSEVAAAALTTEQPAPAGTDPFGAATTTADRLPPRQSLFTSPFRAHEPIAPEPVVFESGGMVAAPLFLSPDAAAAEQERRKRRADRDVVREERREERDERDERDERRPDREERRGERDERHEEREEEPATDEADSESADWDDDSRDDDGDDASRSRRRRRGRRGRGRGRGEQHADSDQDEADSEHAEESGRTRPAVEESDAGAEDTDESAEDADDNESGEGTSRRRRRRRRRKAGEDGETETASEDDPPNTVVHEREPRNKRRTVDEVQGITGSTRLEAKRQRRRDGREAGRRRPPILTESEFLARRESVDRVMVVREKRFATDAGEHGHGSADVTQVAVLEDNILVEHFVTSTGSASMVGNVYLGKVQNVLPSMEAAFVDIGRGRNGVLYAGEVNWEAAGLGGKERKIEQALRPGDTVLVQVSKDPVGHKGARLTTQISLAGRFLVYVPGGTSTGISRKLPDTERKRLKEILRDIVPQDAGVIIRTASEGVSEPELARDVERLQATWRTIEDHSRQNSSAPKTLYEEPDLLVKVIRDLFNEDFSKLVIEGDRAWTTVENYIRTVAPDLLARVERYDHDHVDVFGSYRIDDQLAKALDRKVWLPSGGTLVIDRTEAMTVIDVNTGKFTGAGGSNLEETVTRNNLEAAEEIVRQMRLRDIGGMIVVDFIDMVLESNRDLVLRRLTEALGRDRTRHQVSEVTSLGLVQMTRKKLGTGLVEAFSTTCEHCHGRGIVVHNYPVEAAPAEEGVGGRREGRRRRKDKEKPPSPAPATNGVVSAAEPPQSEEEAAVKRAHPVALAMAAHQTDEAIAPPFEDDLVEVEIADEAEESAPEPERAPEPVAGRAPRRSRERLRRRAERSVDTAVKTDDAAVRTDDAAVRTDGVAEAAPVAAESAAVAAEAAESGARRGRRRVARTASAPSSDSAGAVFVLSSTDQETVPAVDFAESAPVTVPRSRPRRRAAGRAAGAPESTD
ncbi:translation initiation factor IF-2 N-terminal domain-containing protein [Nocardia sp. alder85J]|nr:translation initiation factor IF-2 N-terminal domain-containing protein [Nocardia sp. alder85J]MCX4097444.1 translation initiation factor IF-2 N-terminal domain-containing protein [Nocardia sp. alder85J]